MVATTIEKQLTWKLWVLKCSIRDDHHRPMGNCRYFWQFWFRQKIYSRNKSKSNNYPYRLNKLCMNKQRNGHSKRAQNIAIAINWINKKTKKLIFFFCLLNISTSSSVTGRSLILTLIGIKTFICRTNSAIVLTLLTHSAKEINELHSQSYLRLKGFILINFPSTSIFLLHSVGSLNQDYVYHAANCMRCWTL